MKLEQNNKRMEITVTYESKGEYRKLALQKKMRWAIKALAKGGQVRAIYDPHNLQVKIKCENQQIYEHILKGFGSVK